MPELSEQTWIYIFTGFTFAIYMAIAIGSRVRSTEGFYVAGHGIPAPLNGMATAADWMSAASFLSMAGLISFDGYAGSRYLMGWTGGYVLLALLLAPYLRKFGAFTVPDFVGDRYYSDTARLVAVFCAIFISFTYVAGQMQGVGIVFSIFLQIPVAWGVVIGMGVVFTYATLGGMKGITWTQVVQYCVLIFAYLIPAIYISLKLTGTPIPQLGFGSKIIGDDNPQAGIYLLDAIDQLHTKLGFEEFTAPFARKSMLDMFCITLALMVGTAGLPHVIIRFYTTKNVTSARWSAFWALLFIGLLYTAAPAVATFARVNLIQTLHEKEYTSVPSWFHKWEKTGLLAWVDKDGDGKINYRKGAAFVGKKAEFKIDPTNPDNILLGKYGERVVANKITENANELFIHKDIMVLVNPQIANLPGWVVGLVAAGGLAAALSTAAGLLLVISSSVSHDLMKRVFKPDLTETEELMYARVAAAVAVVIAGVLGIYPPGFVAQVVAFAFGLAASSFFPIIVLGIFSKRTTKEGAIAGMLAGILFTGAYIIYFKLGIFASLHNGIAPTAKDWWWGISPEGIGSIGMLINFFVTLTVTAFTPPPPQEVQDNVEAIRYPRADA